MTSQHQTELGDLAGNGDLVQGWPALLIRMKGVKKNEGGNVNNKADGMVVEDNKINRDDTGRVVVRKFPDKMKLQVNKGY